MNQIDKTFEEYLLEQFDDLGIEATARDTFDVTGSHIDSDKSTSFSFPVPFSLNKERVIGLTKSYFARQCGYETSEIPGVKNSLMLRCTSETEDFTVAVILPPGRLIANIISRN